MKLLTTALLLSVWCWCGADGATAVSGVCPESKRRYPGDCRLFYRCVPLSMPAVAATATANAATPGRRPGVAHAHAWMPTRCTAGLVFEPELKKCVPPSDDWDCRNDDQLIPISGRPVVTEPPQTYEDYTEDAHVATDRVEEYNLVIPHVVEGTAEVGPLDEEPEIVTGVIDRIAAVSTTSRPHPWPYQVAAGTSHAHSHATRPEGARPSVDHIATQMDRIADLAHTLKAVGHTAAPVTVPHTQIPRPADGLSGLINSPPAPAHFATQPHYQLNLLPIQLNKITAQLMQTKQSPIPVSTEQQQTNLNFFGSSVLKHIVEQSAHRPPPSLSDQQNAERLVIALFNKYLANKSFEKKDASTNMPPPLPTPLPSPQPAITSTSTETSVRHVAVALRLKHAAGAAPGVAAAPVAAAACVSGVRLPNATDCRRYYMCTAAASGAGAVVHSYTCPPYTAFDAVRRMCDVAQYARCMNPAGTEFALDAGAGAKGQLERVQLPAEACDTRDKLPDPTSPRRYVLCVRTHDGRWSRHQLTCPGSLVFCPHRNFCSPKSSCY